jgi:hypothetical protein
VEAVEEEEKVGVDGGEVAHGKRVDYLSAKIVFLS